ncbi:MAG: hypothetical protein ACYDA8_17055 [Deferrisomatales bacterium]
MKRLLLLAALAAATPASAASPGVDLLDARALGMGGALRSLAGPTEAPRLNPAMLGPVRGFFAGTSYATRQAGAFDALAVTLIDNVTSPMGGALQYLRLQGAEEREDVSLSLAAGRKGLWWGFSARYVHGRQAGAAQWEDVFTGDVGLLFERPNGLRLAVVGTDLVDTSLDFLERRVALAASKSGPRGWTLAADLVRNLDRDVDRGVDLHLGAEYTPAGPWALRLGQLWRGDTGKDYASAGLGWSRGTLRLGYAAQKARQRSGELLHVVSAEASF